MEYILNRSSVRSFTKAEMSQEDVDKIVKAAMHAPSAVNLYPVHFIVLKSEEALKLYKENHPYAQFAASASMILITCIEPDKSFDKAGDKLLWAAQDGAAATMNAITAGEILGWNSVWTGIYPNLPLCEKIQKEFGIPEKILPLSGIVFGKAAGEVKHAEKYKADKVHTNKW
uniref:Nitroreductase n=1 Tax=Trepomonas sp. PC1 TaxID=1076344 RepID=A0A146KI78_9EUKA|eukprot:JAP95838.1 Nitroreductase [Trepomonas sp. PC1]